MQLQQPRTSFMTWIKWLIVPYHLFLIVGCAIMYSQAGMKKHFGVEKPTSFTPYYFSVVSHTSTGYGDITPKTDYARQLVVAQLCLAWIPTAIFAIAL